MPDPNYLSTIKINDGGVAKDLTLRDRSAYHPTQTELNALNSGITSAGVQQIQDNTTAIGDISDIIEEILNPSIGSEEFIALLQGTATTFTVPETVTTIREYGVSNNPSLTIVTFEGTPSTIASSAFTGDTSLANIHVPWAEGDISGAPWGTTSTPNVWYSYDTYVTISSTGAITADTLGEASSLETVEFLDEPTSISSTAFTANASNIETIICCWDKGDISGSDAPWGATNADIYYYGTDNELVISSAKTSIAAGAYSDATLDTITFLGTPSSISSTAFTGCTNVTKLVVPWAEGDISGAPWGLPSDVSIWYEGQPPVTVVTRQVNFTNNTSPVAPTAEELASSSIYAGITRCNVADDGTILAYYGDSSYKEDGSNGQVMVKIPKFWYKLDAGTATSGGDITVGQWYISDGQLDSSYKLHPAFINASGNEVDYFLIGAFENTFQNGSSYTASYSSSYKMASVGSNGGTSIKPGNTFTRPQGRTCAAARGTGWYQIGFKQIQAVQMLFGVEFGFNSQYTVGQGYTYSSNSATTYVGQTTNVTSGDTTTGGGTKGDMKPVCWRGIENLWGNIRSWIDGFIGNNGTGYFKNDYNFDDTYSSSTYTQIGFTLPSNYYTTYFGYDSTNDWIIFPHSASSSSNPTGSIGDYFYLNTSTNRVCYLGGDWDSGSNAGLFCFSVNNDSSNSYSYIGSRLMYVP